MCQIDFLPHDYWVLSENGKCPKCGGVTVVLYREWFGYRWALRERCNCYGLSCDWERNIQLERRDAINEWEKSKKAAKDSRL